MDRDYSEYTPTTNEVRECFQMSGDGLDFMRAARERGEAFDRWLDARDQEIYERQALTDSRVVLAMEQAFVTSEWGTVVRKLDAADAIQEQLLRAAIKTDV